MIRRMSPWVPRIGRLLVPLLLLAGAAGGGCVPEYNPTLIRSEAEALSDVVQLTGPSGPDAFDRAGQGRFSPDLRWVVFRGVPRDPVRSLLAADAAEGLFVARVVWSGDAPGHGHVVGLDRPIRVTRVGDAVVGACFSPDGFSLVLSVAVVAPGTPPSVALSRLYRADNWAQAVAMTDTARGVDLAQHPITPAGLFAHECDWSPDGKSICFAANRFGPHAEGDGRLGLYAVRPDGSHLVRLGPSSGFARGPAFSPDGSRLLYRGDATVTGSQILLADPVYDLSHVPVGLDHQLPLTGEAGVDDSGPCWLGTDAGHVLYATTRHGSRNAELYVMDADGRRKTRLTLTAGPDVLPATSPDGTHLLWTSTRDGTGAPQLFAADLHLPYGS